MDWVGHWDQDVIAQLVGLELRDGHFICKHCHQPIQDQDGKWIHIGSDYDDNHACEPTPKKQKTSLIVLDNSARIH